MSINNHLGEASKFYVRLFEGSPIPLHWHGWLANSEGLRREGWEFFANEMRDFTDDTHVVQMAARSPAKDMVLSGRIHFPMQRLMARDWHEMFQQQLYGRGFEMNQYKATDKVMNFTPLEVRGFDDLRRINFNPGAVVECHSNDFGVVALRDRFKIFEYEEAPVKEIFVKPSSVDSCLDMILQMQYPEQKELKKLIVPNQKPIIQAKIFSLAA